jgi:hypothetical protein
VTVQAPGISPTPVPASGTTLTRGTITGLLPVAGSNVTVTFLRQDSTGSTFVVNGNAFTYTAGTATGTDVVQLSTPAACGTATGTFTATVTATPGPPKIVSFIADPATSCRLNNNIMLHWVTENATSASIDAATEPIPTSGAYGFSYPPTDLDPSKTYVLTANGPGGKSAKASLTVKVDASLEYPTVSPASATVHSQDNLGLTVGGVVNTQYLNLYVVQMPSGGSVYFNSVGSYTYHAGMVGGVTDIIWITYHNGCGTAHAEFRANVIY